MRPRLPDDPTYWSDLAGRVDMHVGDELARRRGERAGAPVWWARPALSPALAVLALLTASAAWWFVPVGSAAEGPSLLTRALQPADPLAARLLEPVEPDLADLIRRGATGGGTVEEDQP